MKVNLAGSAGFCFGVKRAINIALDTASAEKHSCMLGDIVHNEDVARQMRQAGIKKISRLSSGKGKVLLIRAHGASQQVFDNAARRGYRAVDATCPMVKEIHRIVREAEKRGRKVIILGDKKHDEVRGIAGQLNSKALIIDSPENIPLAALKKIAKGRVVVQSTQNLEKILRIVSILKKHIPDLEFFNTICKPTTLRQEEVKRMPLKNDCMVIIGSKHSANTKRLYEISKSLNKNSHWVNSSSELKGRWFKNAKNVGVTSGASTPDETTRGIIRRILEF